MTSALSRKIAFFYAKNGAITDDQIEIYVYALQKIIATSVSILCSLMIAVCMGQLPQVSVYLLSLVSLRRHTGGLHFSSPIVCFLFSQGLCAANAFVMRYVNLSIPLFALMIVAMLVLVLLAPVNHPNFNVDRETLGAKKKKMIRNLIIQIIVFVALYKLDWVQYGIVFGIISTANLVAVSKIIKQEVKQ